MRSWPGLVAIGAGLIHLGIAAGSPSLFVAASAAGAAELVWGVAALARPQLPLPRAALVGAALLVGLWIVSLLLAPEMHAAGQMMGGSLPALPVGALTGAGVLDLLCALLIAVTRRRSAAAGESHPVVFLLATAAAAAVVAIVTVASLAGTAVGGTMTMH